MQSLDVVIIGAGPYGLAAAAHLRAVSGLQVRVFGEPMVFWKKHMPAGMFLRSSREASHIADPQGALTLDGYTTASGRNHLPNPIPLDRFVDYGRWFQRQAIPDLDTRKIRQVESASGGFRITVEGGEVLNSRRVVVAAGIAPFAWRPPQFTGVPASRVSHSCDHNDLAGFSDKRVLVVGGGQSALESAALLHESGAQVEAIVRNPRVHWLRWRNRLIRIKLIGRLLYSPRDVGPAGISQLLARPDWFRKLPRAAQDRIAQRSIRPAGAAWLVERLKEVPLRTDCYVRSAVPVCGQLRVTLNDGTERIVDHLLLATGYRIDIAKYKFLGPELVRSIDQVEGYPRLKSGLECSVSGLHFLGATAAYTFGPLTRFVSGTYYCVQALTREIGTVA